MQEVNKEFLPTDGIEMFLWMCQRALKKDNGGMTAFVIKMTGFGKITVCMLLHMIQNNLVLFSPLLTTSVHQSNTKYTS